MNKKLNEDALASLCSVRQEIVTYCDILPRLIKAHGPASLGAVTLKVGKLFQWIGPTLDQFVLVQPLPGQALPTVTAIGYQMTELGLEYMHKPVTGEMVRTIETLKKQIELLQKIACRERGSR